MRIERNMKHDENPLLQSSYWEQGQNGIMEHYTITIEDVKFQIVDNIHPIDELDLVEQDLIKEQDNFHNYEEIRDNINYARRKYRWVNYALGMGKLLKIFI